MGHGPFHGRLATSRGPVVVNGKPTARPRNFAPTSGGGSMSPGCGKTADAANPSLAFHGRESRYAIAQADGVCYQHRYARRAARVCGS